MVTLSRFRRRIHRGIELQGFHKTLRIWRIATSPNIFVPWPTHWEPRCWGMSPIRCAYLSFHHFQTTCLPQLHRTLVIDKMFCKSYPWSIMVSVPRLRIVSFYKYKYIGNLNSLGSLPRWMWHWCWFPLFRICTYVAVYPLPPKSSIHPYAFCSSRTPSTCEF